MHILKFKVDGQHITRTDNEKPVAKCRDFFKAHFDFVGVEWTGTKTALFTQGGKSVPVILNSNNECIVPWEFFDTEYRTYGEVSVFCNNLVTANTASVEIEKSGYVNNGGTVPPTPDVYQQIIGRMDKESSELPSKIQTAIDAYDKAHQIEEMATLDEIKAYMNMEVV